MDIQYLLILQKMREISGGVLDSFVLALTTLGEPIITFGLLAAIYWCVDKRTGQLMGLNVSIACTWNQGLKSLFRIDRPWMLDDRIQPVERALPHATGYSFPSGHVTRATAVFGTLAKQLYCHKEKVLSMICALVCILTAFSRNYLGVHTAKDVLASLAMCAFLIVILEYVYIWIEKGHNRDILFAFVVCVSFLTLMFKVGCLSNAGTGVGFLFGWIIERRFIHFEIQGSVKKRVLRFIVGSFILVFFYTVPGTILLLIMEEKYAGFFSNFLFSFVLFAGYPFVFTRIKDGRWKKQLTVIGAVVLLVGITLAGVVHNKVCTNMTDTNEATQTDEVGGLEYSDHNVLDIAIQNVQQEDEVQVIAHRGYSSQFPENTLSSIKGACEIGAGYVELDVQCTKDGVLVIFHDADLMRITGINGLLSDYTYEELCSLDAGSWFGVEYAGERIPTLDEVLNYLQDTSCRLYLELKDIGEVEGFEETVVSTVTSYNMLDKCIFASFNYSYLKTIKDINNSARILYNTSMDSEENIRTHPAEYYGLYVECLSPELVEVIHNQGSGVFVWTVDSPQTIKNCVDMQVDGIVTNNPGLARILIHPEYHYLVDNFESSFTIPGLYEQNIPEYCKDMVVQGIAKTPQHILVSAYSKSGEYNSILYLLNLEGMLMNVVDLQFKAHTGGISYDSVHEYIWVTGPDGWVYAISYAELKDGTYNGDIQVSFDAGLLNHNNAKVASFLTWYRNELFVGSYVDGEKGQLNRYNLSDVDTPRLVTTITIPERIQGITFWADPDKDTVDMYLSQGYQTLDSGLLRYEYTEDCSNYENPIDYYVLPEGIEQIQASVNGIYMLFESSALPYRATARIPNDQVYLVRR